jgi:hypothetical protein
MRATGLTFALARLISGHTAAWCDPSLPFNAYRECRNRPGEECPQPSGQTEQQLEQDRLGRPDPSIGMTASQVKCETNWGSPNRVNTTTTANGTTVQWIYTGELYRNTFVPPPRGYLYFRDGVLYAIQKRGSGMPAPSLPQRLANALVKAASFGMMRAPSDIRVGGFGVNCGAGDPRSYGASETRTWRASF